MNPHIRSSDQSDPPDVRAAQCVLLAALLAWPVFVCGVAWLAVMLVRIVGGAQ